MRDHNEIVRKFAGCTDKAATLEVARNIGRLISFRAANLPLDAELCRWIEMMPKKFRNRLGKIGLLEVERIAAAKPLLEHVADFEKALLAKNTRQHARSVGSMVKKVVKECKFNFWTNVKGSDVELYVAELGNRGRSKETMNRYAKVFRQFCRWMVGEKRAAEMPAVHLEKVPTHFERAFELDEFQKLLEVTLLSGPVRYGMSGYQRYLVYILAVESGLRRGELRSLTPVSFDFKNRTVFVRGAYCKNREDATQRISESTAELFKQYIVDKKPSDKLFALPKLSAIMMREDCEAAGVEAENHKGKLKFHSLRHTCGSFLAAKGVPVKVIMTIMRHKDVNITLSRYCHVLEGQVAAAINKLPDFTKLRLKKMA